MIKSKKLGVNVVANMMEKFIEEGKYPHLKQSEKKIKLLTNAMKERLENSEEKRHEFKKFGLVGRFLSKKIYETDTVSLNEYLYDLGLLLHVVEIDNKKILNNILIYDLIQEFKLPETHYIKTSFNKVGRALNELPHTYQITEQWSLEDMARSIAILKPQVKSLNLEYENLKKKLLSSPVIQKLRALPKDERKPLKHKYGSISVVSNKSKYDVSKIYEAFGEKVLIEYGVPNAKLLENFILRGIISPLDIEEFKTLKDIRLDFSVMTLEDEQKIFELLDRKQMTAAMNRRIS